MRTKPDIHIQESIASQATTGLERFSQSLQDQELHTLVGDVEDCVRRQLVACIGSVALLGFLASQAVKSSAGER